MASGVVTAMGPTGYAAVGLNEGEFRRCVRHPRRLSRTTAPADLDAGRKVLIEARHDQSIETSHLGSPGDFDCIETKSPAIDMRDDSIKSLVAFFTCRWRREVLHHPRVSIDCSECVAIWFLPLPQDKSLCLNLFWEVRTRLRFSFRSRQSHALLLGPAIDFSGELNSRWRWQTISLQQIL